MSTSAELGAMDHSSTDGGGDSVCLVQTPPMSQSMVVREMKRIVQVLEELGTTPLVDTRQITLVDLSISDPGLEGDVDPVPRCALFRSPEQPTKRELAAVPEGEDWLMSLASPAPLPGPKAGVTLANTNQGAGLRRAVVKDPVAFPDLLGSPLLGEAKCDTSEQPSLVQADTGSVCPATLDVLLVQKSSAISEEAVSVDSSIGEEILAVANTETTFSVPAVPAAPSTAAASKKATSNTEAADVTVTLVRGTIPSLPTGWSNDGLPIIVLEEAAAVDSCASEEDLAVASAEATFAIPAVPVAPPATAFPRKGTSDTAAADTTVTLGQGAVARTPAGQSDSATPDSSLASVGEEAAALDSCGSEEGFAVATAETTFAVPAMSRAPSAAVVSRKVSSKTVAAADTTMTLGQGAIPRRPSGQPFPRRSMLQPPSQRAGRLSVPSRLTAPRGRLSVAPTAADTTFGANKATPDGRLSAPKSTLQQPSQRQAAPVSQPATAIPGPRVSSLRRSVAGPSVGTAAAASRRSLQAPASGALASGVAKRGPASRLSVIPATAAASRTSLKPPAKPAATGLRKSLAGPQKTQTPAGQPTAQMVKQASKPSTQPAPQPKPKAALAPQLPRSRLPPPKSRAGIGGMPRPAPSSGVSSSQPPPRLLLPIVESPVPTRLSSTPVRSDAPLCGGPDLTPIRKR
ncbi:uncharacterized protein LOC144106256 isoform X1 [Amblyomma americanum]